jgi:hypothetical protein
VRERPCCCGRRVLAPLRPAWRLCLPRPKPQLAAADRCDPPPAPHDAGKTTLIRFLKPKPTGGSAAAGGELDIVPTIGFSQESFVSGKLKFNVFDMSGAANYRSLWETYYRDVQAVIFVVSGVGAPADGGLTG